MAKATKEKTGKLTDVETITYEAGDGIRSLHTSHELDGTPAFIVKTKEEAAELAAEFRLELGDSVEIENGELAFPITRQIPLPTNKKGKK